MKRSFSIITALLLTVTFCLSCSEKISNTGTISFRVSSESVLAEVTKSNLSSFTALPSGGDFDLLLQDSKEKTIYEGKAKDYPADKALVAGNYTVTATYGDVTQEGFDLPCLKGVQQFTVSGGSTNEVEINATLQNALIKVLCTDMFKKYYTSYSFTIKTGNGSTISFPSTETRAAFVDAYTISVEGNLTNQGGKAQSFTKSYSTSLSPATCYTLKFDASNIGSGTITITFDDHVDDVEPGMIELN